MNGLTYLDYIKGKKFPNGYEGYIVSDKSAEGKLKIFNSVVEDISKGMKKGDEITVEGIYDMPTVVIHKQ